MIKIRLSYSFLRSFDRPLHKRPNFARLLPHASLFDRHAPDFRCSQNVPEHICISNCANFVFEKKNSANFVFEKKNSRLLLLLLLLFGIQMRINMVKLRYFIANYDVNLNILPCKTSLFYIGGLYHGTSDNWKHLEV